MIQEREASGDLRKGKGLKIGERDKERVTENSVE